LRSTTNCPLGAPVGIIQNSSRGSVAPCHRSLPTDPRKFCDHWTRCPETLVLKTLRCAPLETYEWQLRCSGANTVGALMTAAVKQIGNSWRFMRFTIGNLLRSSADRMRLCYETGNDLLKSCFVFRSIRSRITTYLSWQMADLRCGFDQINSNIPYRLSSEYSSFVVGIDSADRTAVWPRPV